jgi:hypothetical protein
MKIFNKHLIIILLLFLFSLFLFKEIVFNPLKLISFPDLDTFNQEYPYRFLAFTNIFKNNITLWNPYLFCGSPFFANPTNQLFYPVNIIFLFLPLNVAINYSFVLHVVIAGIGMYLLAFLLIKNSYLAFISAFIFMFSPLFFLRCFAGHLTTLNAYAWIPFIFWSSQIFLKEKKATYIIITGIFLGVQLLAGHPQTSYYTIIALTAYFLFSILWDYSKNKNSAGFPFLIFSYFAVIFIGLGIAAIRLIPSLEFMRLSDRSANELSFAGAWSFPAQNLLTYLLPEFYGDIVHFPYWGQYVLWEMCGYVGILPLVLSIIAIVYQRNRYTLFFFGLAVFALLGSLGEHTPLFKIFYYFLPYYSKFRGHSKFLILFVFSIPILAAYGLSWLLERKEGKENDFKKLLLALGIISGASILISLFIHFNYSLSLEWWMRLWKDYGWTVAVMKATLSQAVFSLTRFSLLAVAIFLFLFSWFSKRLSPKVFKFFVFAIILLDLWTFGSKYIVANDIKGCYWDRKIVSFLKAQGAPYTYRVMSPNIYGPFPNKALLDGLYMVDGYDAIFLRRYLDLLNRFPVGSVDSQSSLRLLSLVNLKFLVMPKNQKLSNPDLSIAYQTDDVTVWQNSKCLPRAYIVHGSRVINNPGERISAIVSDEHFDPLSTVILEQDPHLKTAQSLAQQPGERAEFLKYSDDEVIIGATLNSSGYLVLSDYNYPGWRVQITNLDTGERKYAEPLYANHIFRAVGLEKGRYSVRFIFEPQSFYLGLKISAVTIIIVALGLIWLGLKNKLRC